MAVNKYLNRFRALGFNTRENWDFISSDPTLLFVNSTMVTQKDAMQLFENIDPVAIVQSCFRDNGDRYSLNRFTMIGISAMYSELYKSGKTMMDFLVQDAGLEKKHIHCVINKDDEDLINLWLNIGDQSNLHLICENDTQYTTRWKYGKGFDYYGRGLTLVYLQKRTPCSTTCGVFCSCRRHLQFGNIIVIEHKNIKYLDFGFGLERLLSCKYDNNLFNLPEIIAAKSDFPEIISSLGIDSQNTIYNIINSIVCLFNCGVRAGNKKEAYVLKKYIRILINTLTKECEIEIFDNKLLELVECAINIIPDSSKASLYVKQQSGDYVTSLIRNIEEAKRWIHMEHIHKEESVQVLEILHDRFGISAYIAKKYILTI
jgi:alanyl-tRNA synthetase